MQQVLIIGDQGRTSRLGQGGKLAVIRVWNKGEPFGMGRSSEAIVRTKEFRNGVCSKWWDFLEDVFDFPAGCVVP